MTVQTECFIEICVVDFSYGSRGESGRDGKVLAGLTLSVGRGEFVALLGGNGSGKTTLARLLNALLQPTAGTVIINGMDTTDKASLWEVRRVAGMVFQNPDSQIVGTTVEEDVAFGPENLGIEPDLIGLRVRAALREVGMLDHAVSSPHLLSGGEKQRVSLAGIIAMKPECVILDEATAFLDPEGRRETMAMLRRLNRAEGITVLLITHTMEEAALADRIVVIDAGRVLLDGKPREVFSNGELLRELGLGTPPVTELLDRLREEGFNLPAGITDLDEAVELLAGIDVGRNYVVHRS